MPQISLRACEMPESPIRKLLLADVEMIDLHAAGLGGLGQRKEFSNRRLGHFTGPQGNLRMGRNPRTGAPVRIPARRAVRFRPSRTIED